MIGMVKKLLRGHAGLKLLASLGLALLGTPPAAGGARPGGSPDARAVEFFEKKVRPILVNSCHTCHSAETKPSGELRVDDRNGLLTGGKSGPAVVPGKPESSLLVTRVTHKDAKRRMPLEGKPLSAAEVAVLSQWIQDGAAWPTVPVPVSLRELKAAYEKLRKTHWAWQPLTEPKVPVVRDGSWPRDPVDRFLLARLEEKGLRPAADADRVSLIRRVSFDLTGLPPPPEAVEAFVADGSALACARVVDRLLASPQFGERWGRHWLDVARFGESTGPSRNIPYPLAWRYRDYVLDAVNADVPFDRFLLEQIAGDLLPAGSARERDRLLTATGFLALGVKDVNQRFKVRFVMDNVDEQIDVVTRGVLGLTVSCARCHDHKFDPVPQWDYYALAGIFTSTDNCAGVRSKMGGGGLDYYDTSMLLPLGTGWTPPPAARVKELQGQVARAKAAWDKVRGKPEGLARGPKGKPKQRALQEDYERLQRELVALTDPVARGQVVHGVRDARTVGDTELRIRGAAEKLGPVVPRGFLTALAVPGAPEVNPKQSGRLELARWLTHPRNPLTARVIVNRVWARLFGEGIVATVDNFGVRGDRPAHAELLDHLALRFVRGGWSVKKLVRALVMTRAYQLGADAAAGQRAIDPANRLVWRHTPRRLDAEELRDAMLAAAGTLRAGRPAGSPAGKLRMVEMQDNGPQARAIHAEADRCTHRSVYLPLLRGLTPHTLGAFDPVEQTLVTGRRDVTTVPGQALYLLNSLFVRRQALALAERLLAEKEATDPARIRKAYRLTLGRVPSAREIERAKDFLDTYEGQYGREAPRGAAGADAVRPKGTRAAAWLALVQALFGCVEFRYVS
jgi:hypothetical protein